jgi:drug/metabolite transporter (DMT)-like permease
LNNQHVVNNSLHPTDLLRGIFWKVASCFCFSAINVCIRYLSTGMHDEFIPLSVHVIYFFQYLFASCLILPFIGKTNFKFRTIQHVKLHIYRVICSIIGTICLYFSFKNMPIVQVLTLSFIGPVFTVIGSNIFLHERMTLAKFFAILASIVGSLLILQPGYNTTGENFSIGTIFLPFISTLAFAFAKITTRHLAKNGETAENLTAYLLILTLPITLIFALSSWQIPTMQNFVCLVFLGVITAMAFFSFNQAYKYAEVTFLLPVGAIKFFTSIILSFLIFNEYPQAMVTWLGIGTIAIGVILLRPGKEKV